MVNSGDFSMSLDNGMNSYMNQEEWDKQYERSKSALLDYHEPKVFKDVFSRYLVHGGSCFEIGCYPGDFLIYLGKTFNYVVSGIDATPFVRSLNEKIVDNGVDIGEIIHGDFFQMSQQTQYDVVCSFGFIEHFEDTEDLIARHVRFVKPGGTLIISSPNFRGMQHLLHRALDKENLDKHNLLAMDLNRWTKALQRNNMIVEFRGHYMTADFWVEQSNSPNILIKKISHCVKMTCGHIERRMKMPNPITSPFMICVARRPD